MDKSDDSKTIFFSVLIVEGGDPRVGSKLALLESVRRSAFTLSAGGRGDD